MLMVLREATRVAIRVPMLLIVAAAICVLASFTALSTSVVAQSDTSSVAAFTALGLAIIAQPFGFHLIMRAWMLHHDETVKLSTQQAAVAAAGDVRIALSGLAPIGLLLLIGAVFFGFGLVLTTPWAFCVIPVMLLRRCGGQEAVKWLRDKLSTEAVISLLVVLFAVVFVGAAATAAARPLLGDYAPMLGVGVIWILITPITSVLVLAIHQNRRLRAI